MGIVGCACSSNHMHAFFLCSGNSIVVGALGQQLVSLASFAFFLAGYEIQTVDFSKESAFTDGMKSLFRQAGLEGKTIGVVIKVYVQGILLSQNIQGVYSKVAKLL